MKTPDLPIMGEPDHGRYSSLVMGDPDHGRFSGLVMGQPDHGRYGWLVMGRPDHGRSSAPLMGRPDHGRYAGLLMGGAADVIASSTLSATMPSMEDVWEGIVVKKSRGLDGSNMYRRLKVRLADGTVTRVRVGQELWRSLEVGDAVTKAAGREPVKK